MKALHWIVSLALGVLALIWVAGVVGAGAGSLEGGLTNFNIDSAVENTFALEIVSAYVAVVVMTYVVLEQFTVFPWRFEKGRKIRKRRR
jgi:uncharacterized membrane protein